MNSKLVPPTLTNQEPAAGVQPPRAHLGVEPPLPPRREPPGRIPFRGRLAGLGSDPSPPRPQLLTRRGVVSLHVTAQLEHLSDEERGNQYISFPIQIEQSLMVGSYDKVRQADGRSCLSKRACGCLAVALNGGAVWGCRCWSRASTPRTRPTGSSCRFW